MGMDVAAHVGVAAGAHLVLMPGVLPHKVIEAPRF